MSEAAPRTVFCAFREPQKKWGPALLPAPTAPSEGYAGVRNLADRSFRLTNPLSILAHQLRRRFPSPSRARRTHPAMFCGPSWVDHSCVPLRSPNLTRRSRNRVALEEDRLFRRLFPAGPASTPERALALPAGGDRNLGTYRTHLAVSGFPGRPEPPSRSQESPCTSLPSRKSEIFGIWPVDNGDIGNNHWNFSDWPN
jgi:hypothetical protein